MPTIAAHDLRRRRVRIAVAEEAVARQIGPRHLGEVVDRVGRGTGQRGEAVVHAERFVVLRHQPTDGGVDRERVVEEVADAGVKPQREVRALGGRQLREVSEEVGLVPDGHVRAEVPLPVGLAEVVAVRDTHGLLAGAGNTVEAEVLVRLARIEVAVELGAERVAQIVVVVAVRIRVGRRAVAGLVLVGLAVDADVLERLVRVGHDRLAGIALAVGVEVHREQHLGRVGRRDARIEHRVAERRAVVAIAERDHRLQTIRVVLAVEEVGEHQRRRTARGRGLADVAQRNAGRRVWILDVVEGGVRERSREVARRLHVQAAPQRQADAVAGLRDHVLEVSRDLVLVLLRRDLRAQLTHVAAARRFVGLRAEAAEQEVGDHAEHIDHRRTRIATDVRERIEPIGVVQADRR